MSMNNWPTKRICISIDGNADDGFVFLYTNMENPEEGCEQVIVDSPCFLEYVINKKTSAFEKYNFKFSGVAFSNPFNSVITAASISENGYSIVLTDPYAVDSKTTSRYAVNFQFGFSFSDPSGNSSVENLLLLSADPEVINHGDIKCPPPGH